MSAEPAPAPPAPRTQAGPDTSRATPVAARREAPNGPRGWREGMGRLDTLALRLFVLMWATLALSHVAAFLAVTQLELHQPGPASSEAREAGGPEGVIDARPPPPPRDRVEGPDGGPPGGRLQAPPTPGGGGPMGPPPMPSFGTLPPTPGVPSIAHGSGAPPAALPASALALDYGVRLVVIALAAWWGSRWVARPMARLAGAARTLGGALARGHRPPPLDEHSGTQEVRTVAAVFNRMAGQIRQLFESRSLMVASISHDLRTPLTRMRMRVETTALPEAQRERCVNDLAEMNALIDAVLDIFRLGAGAGREWQRIDAASLLLALVDDHAELGHAVQAAGPWPASMVVETDALTLRRIVDNLVVNALRYAGSAEVRLEAVDAGVCIWVEDRGPGIPAERLEEVLQPFVRLESSRNRTTGGAGLGLAIASELVRGLGGTLELGNRAGGGLCARVTLPAVAPARG